MASAIPPDEAAEYAARTQTPAIPAATLVVFRRDSAGGPPQLLLLQRSREMAFAGGAAVFPGGRIDPSDRELAARLASADEAWADELAARIAAIRETLEEAGLLIGIAQRATAEEAAAARAHLLEQGALAPVLAGFGWRLEPALLVPFARWRPRYRHTRVFDTRFYLADLGTGAVALAADGAETTRLFWASAAEALRLADSGAIKVIYPTRRNLERLAQFADFAAAKAHAEAFPVRTISPCVEERDGTRWLTIPDDCGYPVTGQPLSET